MDATPSKALPLSLKIVAYLSILGGIFAVIQVISDLMESHININFGVLGIPIGIGLLKLRLGWRTCALVSTWIGLIGFPIFILLVLNYSGPVDLRIFGQNVGQTSKWAGVISGVTAFFFCLWQYMVLTRKDVKILFGLDS